MSGSMRHARSPLDRRKRIVAASLTVDGNDPIGRALTFCGLPMTNRFVH
jgi:hypothetical protein